MVWYGMFQVFGRRLFPIVGPNYYSFNGGTFFFIGARIMAFKPIAMNTLVTEIEKEDATDTFMSASMVFLSLGGCIGGLGQFSRYFTIKSGLAICYSRLYWVFIVYYISVL